MTLRRHPTTTCALGLLIALIAALTSFGALSPAAEAQASVVGTADFRNAPQLPPGQYVDRIVTGDTAWYSIIYTNDTAYNFEVAFQGTAPGADVDLSVSFVAPTLTTVDGPDAVVSGSGVAYPAGHTNVWFLKVSLDTTNQAGIEYPIVLTVDGVQSVGTEPCNELPDCTLDVEYAAVNVALAEATAELEQARSQETLARVQSQIENSQGFVESSNTLGPAAQSRLARAESTMAQLCAPAAMCDEFPDPGTKTPLIGWILGLAVLGFGVSRVVKKLKAEPTPDAEPPRPLSSLEQAKADHKAKNRAKKQA